MLPLPGEELLWEGKGGALADPDREVPPRAGARATISTLHRRNCTVRTLFSPVAQSLLLCRLVQLLPCGAVRCGKLAVLPVLLHTPVYKRAAVAQTHASSELHLECATQATHGEVAPGDADLRAALLAGSEWS